MNDIQKVITQLFVATDQRDWQMVLKCFAPQVVLDYASMTGNPAVELSREAIVESWQGILPGFDYTHHQLGNFLLEEHSNSAHGFCYGTATHFLENEGENIWTVVGNYDFELKKSEDNNWQITQMKFNLKYQAGNTELPSQAMAKLS